MFTRHTWMALFREDVALFLVMADAGMVVIDILATAAFPACTGLGTSSSPGRCTGASSSQG